MSQILDTVFLSKKVNNIKIDGNVEKNVWRKVRPIELVSSVTGKRTKVKTEVRFCHSDEFLYIAYNVFDKCIFATFKNHDDPLFEEEAVEVFMGPGKNWPRRYFEFQFNCLGTSFDARVKNPTGSRHNKGFEVDRKWNCVGLLTAAKVYQLRRAYKSTKLKSGRWTVEVGIPWKSILPKEKNICQIPFWRINFFRIDGYPKQTHFLSYSPTYKSPPDFHVPQKFALLKLAK
jgi:hypothetical protein